MLTPGSPWRSVDGYATLDSTNLEAARRPDPWRVVVADHQSAGRGRIGPAVGGAAGRVGGRVGRAVPMAGAAWGWLPLLTGLAMAQALEQVAGVPAR